MERFIPRRMLERAYDTLAYAAADTAFSESAAVRSALYAAMLAVELDLSPADAVAKAQMPAWMEPARSVSDRAHKLVDLASHAVQNEAWNEAQTDETERFYQVNHVPVHVREHAASLVHGGSRVNAVKYIREETGMGLRAAIEACDALTAIPLPVSRPESTDKDDMEPPF